MPALQPQRQPERGGSASVFCVALLLSLLARPRCPVPAALTHEPGNGEGPACPRRRAFFLVPEQNIRATTTNFNPCGEIFSCLPPRPPDRGSGAGSPSQAKEGNSEASARNIALSLREASHFFPPSGRAGPGSKTDHEHCYPCNRSIVLPIYPVAQSAEWPAACLTSRARGRGSARGGSGAARCLRCRRDRGRLRPGLRRARLWLLRDCGAPRPAVPR